MAIYIQFAPGWLSNKITHCSSLWKSPHSLFLILFACYWITRKDKWYGHNFQFWNEMSLWRDKHREGEEKKDWKLDWIIMIIQKRTIAFFPLFPNSSLLITKLIIVIRLYAITSYYVSVVTSGTSILNMPRLAQCAFIKEAIIFMVHG